MPVRTQTKSSEKIEKLKESKLNKNILIAKTVEAFKPKAKFFTLKKPISKFVQNQFVFEIGQVLYLQNLKNFHWPLKID